QPIVYVARDLERTLGLPLFTQGYYIISNYTTFANSLSKGYKNVLLIKNKELLDTRDLLVHPSVKKFIGLLKNPSILVFKNTPLLEKICAQSGYKLLNPSAELSNLVEEKISQVSWLGELKKFLPPHEVKAAKEVRWQNKKFILQFNRAHTGSGTVLIENEKQLAEIQKNFPDRPVRVTKYIDGVMLTNNNVVWGKKVLCGNINAQITGIKPFTSRSFATVGNDWSYAHKILRAKQKKEYEKIAKAVGEKLSQNGWRGLFGIDVMLETKTGKLFLIEINARQPASTSFESQLQQRKNKNGLTTFQAHLLALIGEKNIARKLTVIKDGAQITQKVMSAKNNISEKKLFKNISKFCQDNFQVFIYENTEAEADWIRLQCGKGILKDQNTLNQVGEKCRDFSLSILEN
ncbi:MAG: ATP-grasp domain-containing protein, partial [Candidatus Magasanikbacteria bacterium]|nr:ATP-grasp domain-containing protein [Candidatus Magasanikbacteria bacterium]